MEELLKRGQKVEYYPDAQPGPDDMEKIAAGLMFKPKLFKPLPLTHVWAHFSHIIEFGYIIQHPDGWSKEFFLSSPTFPDGFESIHSSVLADGLHYIYAHGYQLKKIS